MDLTIETISTADVTISNVTPKIDITLSQIGVNVSNYKGEYDVTPTIDGKTLQTANKVMEKDVNIKAIPFYEVSNAFNGETVYIAKEI